MAFATASTSADATRARSRPRRACAERSLRTVSGGRSESRHHVMPISRRIAAAAARNDAGKREARGGRGRRPGRELRGRSPRSTRFSPAGAGSSPTLSSEDRSDDANSHSAAHAAHCRTWASKAARASGPRRPSSASSSHSRVFRQAFMRGPPGSASGGRGARRARGAGAIAPSRQEGRAAPRSPRTTGPRSRGGG